MSPTRHKPPSRALFALLAALALGLVSADCECGYVSAVGPEAQPFVFTDLIESDFGTVHDIIDDTDWVRQVFNLTKERARGDYGELFDLGNVATDNSSHDAALQLTVRADTVAGLVPVAEIDSRRVDVFWGTFRASMKLSKAKGTCAAFFWYFNDTEEIDMEFLNKDFDDTNSSYPVNLVLQSRAAATAGYDARGTANFVEAYLPFDPTAGFHEYRFDYVPGHVYFYADAQLLAHMNGSAVPSSPGHLVLQHWSNGNDRWSGGPPAEDAIVDVRYVKGYFNSSRADRERDWRRRCADAAAAGALCPVPDGTNASAEWFFSKHGNMTNNQTVYNSRGETARPSWTAWVGTMGMLLAAAWISGSAI